MPGALAVSVVASRTLEPSTLAELVGLADAARAAGLAHPSDQAMLDLSDPAASDSAMVVVTGDPPAGFATVDRHDGWWVVEVAVGPHPPVPRSTVEASAIGAALGAVASLGGGPVRLWRHGGELAVPAGFRLERELRQLRVALPLPHPPPTATVRAFRPGLDEAAWLAVNNRAFAGHPEQSGWTLADVVRREAEPWFDPAGFLLHEATGRLAAFCWTKVHVGEGLGEIYVIGVDPDFQGRGLGRTMTEAGLAHLAGRGVATGMLYVDASNAPAVGLYASLGFELHHADRSYVGEVPARTGP